MKTNLEILLSEWGEWQAGMNRSGLGLPSQSAFARMRVDHDRAATSPDVKLVDDDMRRVDAAINDLHADMRVVMVAHYVWGGPVKTKADRLKLQPRVYYFALEHGHKQLSHVLGGIYATGYEPKLCTHMDALCT